MSVCIYGLIDPRSMQVRYIGKTKQKPAYRLTQHIARAKKPGTASHILNWLRQLLAEGLSPEIRIFERVADGVDWRGRERAWIARGHDQGWPLTNMTEGGEGITNPSRALRRQRSGRMRGNTYAVGNRNAAGKRSDAFRQRMAEAARQTKNALGHTVPEETRRGISEALKEYYASGGERMCGERCGQSKLTESQVREIRERYAGGGVSMRALGREYGVSHEATRRLICRNTWKHVD